MTNGRWHMGEPSPMSPTVGYDFRDIILLYFRNKRCEYFQICAQQPKRPTDQQQQALFLLHMTVPHVLSLGPLPCSWGPSDKLRPGVFRYSRCPLLTSSGRGTSRKMVKYFNPICVENQQVFVSFQRSAHEQAWVSKNRYATGWVSWSDITYSSSYDEKVFQKHISKSRF